MQFFNEQQPTTESVISPEQHIASLKQKLYDNLVSTNLGHMIIQSTDHVQRLTRQDSSDGVVIDYAMGAGAFSDGIWAKPCLRMNSGHQPVTLKLEQIELEDDQPRKLMPNEDHRSFIEKAKIAREERVRGWVADIWHGVSEDEKIALIQDAAKKLLLENEPPRGRAPKYHLMQGCLQTVRAASFRFVDTFFLGCGHSF